MSEIDKIHFRLCVRALDPAATRNSIQWYPFRDRVHESKLCQVTLICYVLTPFYNGTVVNWKYNAICVWVKFDGVFHTGWSQICD